MPTSTMSVDRVVNFGIGKDLLEQFMQFDIRAIKKDGHDFYTYAIKKPRINKEGWEKLHDYQKYLYTDTNYTPGEFWGETVEMKKNDNSGTKNHHLGNLSYNVPNADTEHNTTEDAEENYIFSGSELTVEGTTANVNYYVQNSGILTNTSGSTYYQVLFSQPITSGSTLDINAGEEYSAENSTTVSRSFGIDANLEYTLKETIGYDEEVVSSSIEETIQAGLDINMAESNDQTDESDSTITLGASIQITNNTAKTYQFIMAVPTNQSQSDYTIKGQLASVPSISPADDKSLIQRYHNSKGQKPTTHPYLYDIKTVLEKAKSAISCASGIAEDCPDGISENDNSSPLVTFANNIDPDKGYIYTTGTLESYAAKTEQLEYWFYDKNNNCYASGLAEVDGGCCDRNDEAEASGLDTNDYDGNCETSNESTNSSDEDGSRGGGIRSTRLQELEFDPELFTLSSLKNMHKIKPRAKESISIKIGGKDVDVSVGSMAETYFRAFAIGRDVNDWHLNKVKGEHGGSILHKGADRYSGNTGRDFVSSKSVGGGSSINTKSGDDTVLIDAKKFKKFTPGQTHLGKGHDTFFYMGSKKYLGELDGKHENLITGKGRDTIIIKNNAKLNVEDFDLKKDTLKMNFEEYEINITGYTIAFTSEEGGSVILRDVLNGYNGSYDSLPFS